MKRIAFLSIGVGLIFISCTKELPEKKAPIAYNEIAESRFEIERPASLDSTIVDIARSNANFTTFVRALEAGSMTEVLSGSGPYTVFLPINSAFRQLPKDKIDFYKNPENRSKITDLLTYHVIAGEYRGADVLKAVKQAKGKFETNTIKGEKITIMMDGKNVVVKDAKGGKAVVIKGDIGASNGVVHVINAVLMPKD